MLLARKLIYGSAPPSPSICTVASPAPVPNTVSFFEGLIPIPTFPLESMVCTIELLYPRSVNLLVLLSKIIPPLISSD